MDDSSAELKRKSGFHASVPTIGNKIIIIIKSKKSLFVLIILLVFAFVVLLAFQQSSTKHKLPSKKIYVSSSPAQSISYIKAKALKPGLVKGIIRYADYQPDEIDEYDQYANRNGKLKIITLNIETLSSTSAVFNYANGWFRELTPDGRYYVLLTAINSEEMVSGMAGTHPAYSTCNLNVVNLMNNTTYHESVRAACGGPPPNYEMIQLPRDNLVVAGRGRFTMLSDTMKPILKFPSQGITKSSFEFTSDYTYFTYGSVFSFVSLDEFYPTFGIIKSNSATSKIVKFFNENNAISNDFVCWIDHKALFHRTTYQSPPDGITTGKIVSQEAYLYDADNGYLNKICDGDNCEADQKASCNSNKYGLYDNYPRYDIKINEFINDISKQFSLEVERGYMYMPLVNKEGSLVVFTASLKKDLYDSSKYIYIVNLKTSELYQVGRGEQPRWM